MGKKRYLYIFLYFCLLFADNQKLQLEDINFNRTVNSIFQDSFGFLWFGTENGLYRYDGEQYLSFKLNPYDENSLTDDVISEIQENACQQLIIGTKNGGINILNLNSDHIFNFYDKKLNDNKITSLLALEDCNWFGTKSDLFLMEIMTDTMLAIPVKINNEISDIKPIEDNEILATTLNDGFYIISSEYDEEWKFGKEHYLKDFSVNFAFPVMDKIFLIGTSGGLYIFNVNTKKLEILERNKFSMKINATDKKVITKDESGNIWIGSGYKLYKIKAIDDIANIQIETFDLNIENRFSRGVNLLYYDKSGVLWISIRGKGLYKYYPKRNFAHYTVGHGLMSNVVFSILEQNAHSVLLGTHHGIFLYDLNTHSSQRLPNTEALNYQIVTSLYKDKNMNLWCGTNEGLFKLTPDQKLIKYQHESKELSSISSNIITSITGCNDREGDIWVGTCDGLNRYRAKYDNFIHYYADETNLNSLPGNDIEYVYLSSKNDLWVGTYEKGLSVLKANEMDKFDPKFINFSNIKNDKNSLSNNKITYITEDYKNNIWAGTSNGGLNKIDSLWNFYHFMEIDGLIDNEILSIVPAPDDELWISTYIGVSKYDMKTEVFKNYYFKDGIKDGDYLQKSSCIMSNREILFGSKSGFTQFHPERIQNNLKLAIPQIADFFVYNKKYNPVEEKNPALISTDFIKLKHDENVVSMYICGLHYVNPIENSLAYYMEGIDTDWHISKNHNYITYSNLKPGTYKFRLKASNNDNIWNPEERVLKVKVITPFYDTILFRLLILGCIITVIYGFVKYRMAKVAKRRTNLEKQIWEKNKKNEELNEALQEVKKLKNQLQNENIYLKSEIITSKKHKNIVTDSKKMKSILHQVEIASGADPTILILGESGTGKDLLANAIHQTSSRRNECFIKVDCAALPPNLIESELFGHEKGAFTGANKRKIGRFELANGGTIFLDEIGELPIKVQQKLLRVLQSGEFERLGNSITLKTNTRIIAATNRDLETEVKNGQFREDLFYRLNVFPINLPPLRERIEDIPLLVQHFVAKYSTKFNKNIEKIPQNVIMKLMNYRWPGNIRELENVIQRSIIVSPENVLELGDWFGNDTKRDVEYEENLFLSLDEIQKRHIEKILDYTNGKVSGENGAAEILKINPKTLFSRMKRLNINN